MSDVAVSFEIEKDPVVEVYENASKVVHLVRQTAPGVGACLTQAYSATQMLQALGFANILYLYVNIMMQLGGAYAAAKEEVRMKGFLMGFSSGLGERLAGTYDYGRLMWDLTHQGIGHDFSRKLAQIHTQAYNSALIKGASAASHLSREHRQIIVQELRREVQGRYPKSFTEGEQFAAYIHHKLRTSWEANK